MTSNPFLDRLNSGEILVLDVAFSEEKFRLPAGDGRFSLRKEFFQRRDPLRNGQARHQPQVRFRLFPGNEQGQYQEKEKL